MEKTKNKVGRPKVPPELKKKVVSIYMDDEQHEDYKIVGPDTTRLMISVIAQAIVGKKK